MYYAEKPTSSHDIHELKVELLGEAFDFLSDAGVFSKKRIDYGSQVLLNALTLKSGKTLLDIGCGYGPLGLTLAKVQGVKVTMVDINLRALALAQKNADRNNIKADIFQSDLYENVESSFDYIISNPPIRAGKKTVHRIIEEGLNHLNSGGFLTLVIQKKQGAPSAKAKMEAVFGNCEILKRDKGYYILQSEKI
ncbi:class I SAM-dependent methyltransferase [Streptococcus pantholopis]|uniref:Methyltransferase n=1 Tax=Streptococcus pantholopis TaxID=1811193 RepID=A0A172Q7K9_9STRE|nr:class I SAM-dependent methyltransferase [Streptococcus pantholopis]AND79385.1 methyltransferase [Streptococcus pantholopis]